MQNQRSKRRKYTDTTGHTSYETSSERDTPVKVIKKSEVKKVEMKIPAQKLSKKPSTKNLQKIKNAVIKEQ